MTGALLALLSSGVTRKTLLSILDTVLQGSSVRGAVTKRLEECLDAQAGRSGGKLLGRAICEQIDRTIELEDTGASVEERTRIADELAKNAAVQLAEAAELVLAYPALQSAVAKAKKSGDKDALKAARAARDAGAERVKQALVDVGRVAAGSAPADP